MSIFAKQIGRSDERLDLCDRDLSWIHPDYEQEFQLALNSQKNLVA